MTHGITIGGRPLATDHLIEPSLSQMTGSDVVLTGVKADGKTPYLQRRLSNVSFVPHHGGRISVIGLDQDAGGVRQFDLSGVSRMDVIDDLSVSEHGLPGGEVATPRAWMTYDSDGIRAILANARHAPVTTPSPDNGGAE